MRGTTQKRTDSRSSSNCVFRLTLPLLRPSATITRNYRLFHQSILSRGWISFTSPAAAPVGNNADWTLNSWRCHSQRDVMESSIRSLTGLDMLRSFFSSCFRESSLPCETIYLRCNVGTSLILILQTTCDCTMLQLGGADGICTMRTVLLNKSFSRMISLSEKMKETPDIGAAGAFL